MHCNTVHSVQPNQYTITQPIKGLILGKLRA